MIPRGTEFWLLVVCGGLFAVGTARLGAGMKRAAGTRDSLRWLTGAMRLIGGVVAIAYLVRTDLPALLPAPFGWPAAAACLSPPLWVALVGLMRLMLLSWPRGAAIGKTQGFIKDDEFTWD